MRLRTLCYPLLLTAAALPQETVTFKASSNLVIVNVEVKDRAGKPLEGLRAADFEITENGKAQKLSVFEFQRMDAPPADAPKVAPAANPAAISTSAPGQLRYRDKRLILLYFDLSSMAVPEQIRARRAALDFLNKNLQPNDLVAVMKFATDLKVLQDFTGDKEVLQGVIKRLSAGEGSDQAAAANADAALEDTGEAFTADTSEFDIFNTDRKLSALESAVKMLTTLPEKKALVYFSSGVNRTGTENESQLRSTINAAIRANVAFYPVDSRGLTASAPGGDVTMGASSGSGIFSGASQRQRQNSFNTQQETLYALAADTGGKALLDSNDLAAGIVQAQNGFVSYYVLGYYTTDASEDGRYRRVQVKLKSPEKLKVDYRAGYYAPKSFAKYTESDKERQLEEALHLGDPVTDMQMALEIDYFRRAKDRYIVPVAVRIPGAEIPVKSRSQKDEAKLDFIAEVRDTRGRPVASVRDFIKIQLSGENAGQLAARMLEYDTAFTLPPGEYHLKFVARENESGKLGTFETKFTVPDLTAETKYLRASSVVWSNQRVPLAEAIGAAEKKSGALKNHPLVHDGRKLIPNITKVFREGQQLYALLEVYEPGAKADQSLDVEASVSLFSARGKVLESEPVVITAKADAKSPAAPVELHIPLENLAVGSYTCQLSVVDKVSGRFVFNRTPLVILPAMTSQ